ITVIPRTRVDTDDTEEQLRDAAWLPGDTFTDGAEGLSVTIGSEVTDGSAPAGSFSVTVHWSPPLRADLVAADIWLDSPHNGFSDTPPFNPSNYDTRLGTDGAPVAYGDGVFIQATPLGPVAVEHRLHLRVRNNGSGPTGKVRGHVFICASEAAAVVTSG